MSQQERFEHILDYLKADMLDRFSPIMNAICDVHDADPFDDHDLEAIGKNMALYHRAAQAVVTAEEETATQYPDDSLVGAMLRAVERLSEKSIDPTYYQWAGQARN